MTNIFNPLDLHGPAFLAYYTIVGAAIVGALVLLQRRRESLAAPSNAPLSDPYLVAYLRGGETEAVKLAVVTLVDRGLLEADDTWLTAKSGAAEQDVEAPLPRALLAYFTGGPGRVQGAMDDPGVRVTLEPLERTLLERGLIPTPEQHLARGGRLLAGAVLLWTVTGAQISHRPENATIGLLLVLTIAFTAGAAYLSFRRRTAAGDRLLADVRELMEGPRSMYLTMSGSGSVPTLVMAAFGLSLLPSGPWAFLDRHLPGSRKTESGGSCAGYCGGSSGCGSACGGGCGGGCGGCGE